MKKWVKIALPIVCVLVVVITFALLFDMKNKTKTVSNENQNSVNEENVVTTQNTTIVLEDENENKVDDKNEVVDGSIVSNTTLPENVVQEEVMSSEEDKYSGNKQSKAIELVKKNWGADNSVYYTNESANSDEEYIVAVRDKSTTEVKHYFKVNINTGTVVVDY